MADVFLSYASEDRDRAVPVAEALIAAGWSVWWDQDIHAGDDWDKSIERELDVCSVVVTLFTTTSVDSRWVRAEAMFGLEHNKLIPVVLDGVRMPVIFHTVQAIIGPGDPGPILEAVAAKITGVAPVAVTKPPERAGTRRISWWIGGGAIVVVLIASIILLYPLDILSLDPETAVSHTTSSEELDALIESANALPRLARIEKYESLVAEYPNRVEAWVGLGWSYVLIERRDLALEPAKRAIALDSKLIDTQILMGRVTTGSEKIRHLEEALRLEPNSTEVLARLAYYYGSDGQEEKSRGYYERALELEPDDPGVHRQYARMLADFGEHRYSQSLAHMDRATAIDGELGYRAPYFEFNGDLFGSRQAIYDFFLESPDGLRARNVAQRLDPITALKWLDIAEKLSAPPQEVADYRARAYAELGNVESASTVIKDYERVFPDGPPIDNFGYQFEAAARAAADGDLTTFTQLRSQTRDELEALLEPYRTIDGYRIANITEIHFSESIYFFLLLTAWSLDDEELTYELADVLHDHWLMPRIANLGPGHKNLQLATISALRGNHDEALSYLDATYRAGVDPAELKLLARRFDLRGEWSELLNDPRYIDLVERSDKMRAQVRAQVKAEMPLLLAPDIDLLRAEAAEANST